MPMIAIGSSGAVGATTSTEEAPRRCEATSAGVGWSNTRESGRRRPIKALREALSSVAVIESKPSDSNVWSGGTVE
ncbi:hypothetical protein Lesp02_07260 [Lentzea sp. NBRC 105346]|nr:hypothetical protein Lesp02_07260 [Lentzea sp. NBRC 105346]